MQKILLGSDGSVTQILEAITGKQVVIETRVQKITPADPITADRLMINEGDPVNYRIVEIKTSGGKVLIYAISHTPIARLSQKFSSAVKMLSTCYNPEMVKQFDLPHFCL